MLKVKGIDSNLFVTRERILRLVNASLGIHDECITEAENLLNALFANYKNNGVLVENNFYYRKYEGAERNYSCFENKNVIDIEWEYYDFFSKLDFERAIRSGLGNKLYSCEYTHNKQGKGIIKVNFFTINGHFYGTETIQNCAHELFHCFRDSVGIKNIGEKSDIYIYAAETLKEMLKNIQSNVNSSNTIFIDGKLGYFIYQLNKEEIYAKCHELYVYFSKMYNPSKPQLTNIIKQSDCWQIYRTLKIRSRRNGSNSFIPSKEDYEHYSKFYSKFNISYEEILEIINGGVRQYQMQLGRTICKLIDDFELTTLPNEISSLLEEKDSKIRLSKMLPL